MDPHFDADLFKERLAETIFWCNSQMKISTEVSMLRTLASEPKNINDLHQNASLLEMFAREIFNERKRQIGRTIYHPGSEKINLQNGILVIFIVDWAAAKDGVAQIGSKGFFDYFGFPAWDTWVYHAFIKQEKPEDPSDNHIICWVPPQFISAVRNGIAGNWDEALLELDEGRKFFHYLELIDDLIEK